MLWTLRRWKQLRCDSMPNDSLCSLKFPSNPFPCISPEPVPRYRSTPFHFCNNRGPLWWFVRLTWPIRFDLKYYSTTYYIFMGIPIHFSIFSSPMHNGRNCHCRWNRWNWQFSQSGFMCAWRTLKKHQSPHWRETVWNYFFGGSAWQQRGHCC